MGKGNLLYIYDTNLFCNDNYLSKTHFNICIYTALL